MTNGIYTKHLNYEDTLENITIGDSLFSFSILQGWKIGQFLQRKKKSKFSWKIYTEKNRFI